MSLGSILLEIVSTEAPVEAASLRYWHYRKNWQLTPSIDSILLYKYRLRSPPQPCKWWLLRFLNCSVNYLLLGHLVKTSFFLVWRACDCSGLIYIEKSQCVCWPQPSHGTPFLPTLFWKYDLLWAYWNCLLSFLFLLDSYKILSVHIYMY